MSQRVLSMLNLAAAALDGARLTVERHFIESSFIGPAKNAPPLPILIERIELTIQELMRAVREHVQDKPTGFVRALIASHPALRALSPGFSTPRVLFIDEIDKALDASFESDGRPKRPPTWTRIEIEEYAPTGEPGQQRLTGRITRQRLADLVNAQLKAGFRTYGPTRADEQLPSYRWISCYAVTGNSEGHYVHVDAVTKTSDGGMTTVRPLLLAKTFQGMEYATTLAAACSHMLA